MSRSNHTNEESKVRMELKYCEHCGGLWTRECGAGVYCQKCEAKVADLPIPKKKPGRIILPVQANSLVEDYGIENCDDDGMDFEAAAAGGVA